MLSIKKFKPKDIILYDIGDEVWLCYITDIDMDIKYYLSMNYISFKGKKFKNESSNVAFSSEIGCNAKLIKENSSKEEFYKYIKSYESNLIFQ